MELVKKAIENNDGLSSIELIKDNKHFSMSKSPIGYLRLSFSYDEDKEGLWFQEDFTFDKNDGAFYDAVEGIFLSYGGDVFFDTYGANLILVHEDDSYRFLFMKEFDEGTRRIDCDFIDDTMENNSLKGLYMRMQNIPETKKENVSKPKTLSKTLNNIVEK